MSNRFDFELRADDKVSDALKAIDERVRALQPELDKTRNGLSLGGQETHDGLSGINQHFSQLSRSAKENVQLLGDMVPPLRNFSGLAGKMGGFVGKLGLVGGAAYLGGKAIHSLGANLSDAADDAYGLQVAAQNAGMSVKDLTQLSGAMHILGADTASARAGMEGLYKTFNDALQGRNSGALAVMNQVHAQIVRNADGTANVMATVENLAKVFPKLTPQNQKTVADAIGLNEEQLQLMREGAHLKELLAKSDAIGLTVDPKVNKSLADLNRSLTETGAKWDGLKQRIGQGLSRAFLSGGHVKNMVEGTGDILQHGPDDIALMHQFNLTKTNEAEEMRDAYKHPEFMKSLTGYEKFMHSMGLMTEGFERKYQQQIVLPEKARRAREDSSAAAKPVAGQPPLASQPVNGSALSVVNNNPWNLRYAGQKNAEPGAGDFARFNSGDNGVKAAERQLMLYYSGKSKNVDHPLQTLAEIISTASPAKDHNNTPQMIQDASRELGVSPYQQLDLSGPEMRSRVLGALFNREGNNPYSVSQIQSIIQRPDASPGIVQPPFPQERPDTSPALVQPALLPAPPAGVQQAGNVESVSRAIAEAMKENGVKVELTLVDSKTGERRTVTGAGSRVATSMQFP